MANGPGSIRRRTLARAFRHDPFYFQGTADMDIKRIGRNPSGTDSTRSRASQISVHNGTVYFAATPDRPFDPGASITVQTRQMLKRVDERLALAGSDKSKILAAHVMIS